MVLVALILSLICLFVVAYGTKVTLSNVAPRLDTKGNIVNAHDGNVVQWDTNGKYYWYAMAYSECVEPAGLNGCSDAGVNNSCGFQYNHTVNLYVSPDLTSGSWQFIANVLPVANRPTGIVFAPSVVYNKNTQKYVLYANYLPTNNFATSLYFAAESDTAEGPFKVSNPTVNLTDSQPGDGKLFVDDDGKGYYLYTSISMGHKLVVEQLTDDYLYSTGLQSNVMALGCLEAPVLIKHYQSGLYFVLTSFCCCYCGQGGDVAVFVSENVLGPYVLSGYINDETSNGQGKIIISAQETDVFPINTTNNGIQYLWIGDRWQTAPDKLKAHDFTYWGPLVFEGNGKNTTVQTMQWRDNFTIDIY